MTAEREHETAPTSPTGSPKMENRKLAPMDVAEQQGKGPADKVFHFLPAAIERPPEKRAAGGRDWGAALDLIAEAAEAVRLAEDRTVAAEQYNQQLTQFYKDQSKVAEAKIAAAEKRAEAAELRAAEAEEWLGRLHDAIVTGFKGVVESR